MANAIFSPCRTWRYQLTRVPALTVKSVRLSTVVFIGLNPSTADETTDDPTVRRCVAFAERWGFERMVMLNAFAFRATNPRRLRAAEDPIGPENDAIIVRTVTRASMVVCAWGNHALWHPRGGPVTRQAEMRFLLHEAGVEAYALGVTKLGAPKHPLYLRADTEPQRWL